MDYVDTTCLAQDLQGIDPHQFDEIVLMGPNGSYGAVVSYRPRIKDCRPRHAIASPPLAQRLLVLATGERLTPNHIRAALGLPTNLSRR